MEAIVLVGIQIARDRDPRKVAGQVKDVLSVESRRLGIRGLPEWKPETRWQKGGGKAGDYIHPKVEVELRVTARDMPQAIFSVCCVIPMMKILKAAGAEYGDVLYVEGDRVRD